MDIAILLLPEEQKRPHLSHYARNWAEMLLKAKTQENVVWAVDTYGKPFLASHPHIHFNLAHSGRIVLFGIAEEDIGVDVEFCRPREYSALAKRYFHPIEQAWASINWAERFYEIWTAKESYLKAIGIGIRKKLSSFSVIDENGKLLSPEGSWYFFPLEMGRIVPSYKGCVCTLRPEQPSSIQIWEIKENHFFLSQKIDKTEDFSVL
ncbi:4'-phosphopantetheinyl transferase family protein [Thermospira aquatica]|uniref:4'-phosphopantetheinyl transferase superfamily protein n=1 Tax=Thermospira aquatica TaxID=2828656 RepID=A0AAX3BAH2_9SPIR|nr:4'-phosphopantetheinyl transferase superfamily protein [Thermospira aquatica]URA09257.1 4'-phosphopantetheinyl transferase superfamily protein [Thermospira aquatica]